MGGADAAKGERRERRGRRQLCKFTEKAEKEPREIGRLETDLKLNISLRLEKDLQTIPAFLLFFLLVFHPVKRTLGE